MRIHNSVKSISQFKTHASEMLRSVSETKEAIVITQNGEAKAILQDVNSYDTMQEGLALMKILLQSQKSVKSAQTKNINDSFKSIRSSISEK